MFAIHRHRPTAPAIGRRSRRHRRIITLEGLEERIVLSSWPVTKTVDDGTANTLRWAIAQANAEGGGSTITFDPGVFATHQTITLSSASGFGTLNLTESGGTEAIQGPAAGVTIRGGTSFGAFEVDSGVNASISTVTITGGRANYHGGGISNLGTLTVTDSTISANSATQSGGGIYNAGTLTVVNSTIAGNSALSEKGGHGGGIYDVGTLTVIDSTLAGNSAGELGIGGGLWTASGTATLDNTIISLNTRTLGGIPLPADIYGTVDAARSDNNLIGTGGAGGLDPTRNFVGITNPGLAPLGDHGGPNQTMALRPGSIALGHGSAISGITTDQRGATRAESGPVDIGAFQDQGYTLSSVSGSDQHAVITRDFGSPLVVRLTENYLTGQPIADVPITLASPAPGAGATFAPNPATTDATGQASTTATANATAGAYSVTASVPGLTPASFDLTNDKAAPTYSGLSAPISITYGTASITVSGQLVVPADVPSGETVSITIGIATTSALLDIHGNFSTAVATSALHASATPYPITIEYAGDSNFDPKSDGSRSLKVDKANQTITVTTPAPTGAIYGTSFTVAATSSSGLTVSYGVTGVASITGGTGTMTSGTGTATVHFDQAGDADYNPATAITQDVSAQKAVATISVSGYSLTYDGAPHTATGSATGIHGEALAGLDLGGTTHTGAGTHAADPWTFTDATGNYDNASGTVGDSIARAGLTVTADSTSKVYGTTLSFAGTDFTAAGLVGGDKVTSVTLNSAGAAASATVGHYPITPSSAVGSGLGNYDITYVPGTLTVAKAATTTVLVTAGGSSAFGQQVTFTAQVAAGASPATPTGAVIFLVDHQSIGTAGLDSSGRATLNTTALAVGGHSVVTVYPGSDAATASQSAPISWQVNQASTSNVLTISRHGNKIWLTAQVAPVAPGGGTPAGPVSFYRANGQQKGTVALGGNSATLVLNRKYALNKTFWARYNGNSSFLSSEMARAQVTNRTMASHAALARPSLAGRPGGAARSAMARLSAVVLGALPSFTDGKAR